VLPSGEKGFFAPSPLRGEGWGEGDLIASSNSSKKYSCDMRARQNSTTLFRVFFEIQSVTGVILRSTLGKKGKSPQPPSEKGELQCTPLFKEGLG